MTRSKPKNSPPTHVLVGGFSLLILVTILISFVQWQSPKQIPTVSISPDKQSVSLEEMNALASSSQTFGQPLSPALQENKVPTIENTAITKQNEATGTNPTATTQISIPTQTPTTETTIEQKTGNAVNVPTTVDVRDNRTQPAP